MFMNEDGRVIITILNRMPQLNTILVHFQPNLVRHVGSKSLNKV